MMIKRIMGMRKILNEFKYLVNKNIIKPKIYRFQNDDFSVLNCIIAYNMYGGYCIPLSSIHRPVCKRILIGDVYEPDTINYITSNYVDGDIVHAGTYFGDFLPAISKCVSDGFNIWAFEPDPVNFRCSLITKIINSLDNVKIFNCGLGSCFSIEKMLNYDSDLNCLGGSSMILDNGNQSGMIDVNVIPIDEIIPNDRIVSFIHLDVEGYEKNALQGAIKTIKRCRPVLILEDNNNVIDGDWFSDNILSLGYKIDCSVHENKVLKLTNLKVE